MKFKLFFLTFFTAQINCNERWDSQTTYEEIVSDVFSGCQSNSDCSEYMVCHNEACIPENFNL